MAKAAKAGRNGFFFTLEYTREGIIDRFGKLGVEPCDIPNIVFDCSDMISADHIMEALCSAPHGTMAAIDYLQLLDQRRDTPPLQQQVETLKAFGRARGLTIVVISQIDRAYDPSLKAYPDMQDVRLPNPVDVSLFDKACFLNGSGSARIYAQR